MIRPKDWPCTDGWRGTLYASYLGLLGVFGFLLGSWIASKVLSFHVLIIWL